MTQQKNTTLQIKIDREVFKLKCDKVARLRTGKMSVELFAMTINRNDPFILIGDTIYALTPEEYYALKAVRPVDDASESIFRSIVDSEDLSYMDEKDKAIIKKIRAELPTCSTCTYKKYKSEVRALARKYGKTDKLEIRKQDYPPYPETSGEILPNASNILTFMYKAHVPARTSCMDCVEKHVAQAWVTGNEAVMGYPEHIAVAIAHLSEALEETPIGYEPLYRTLEYCLARTELDGRVFVPLHLILPLIQAARDAYSKGSTPTVVQDTKAEALSLDITDQMMTSLSELDDGTKDRLCRLLASADDFTLKYKIDPSEHNRVVWEGSMACAADLVAGAYPEISNVLRNLRLLFIGDPGAMADAGYGLGTLISTLKSAEHSG